MKIRITFDVEPELDVKIQKSAKKRGLSRSAWLRYILLDVFAGNKPTP